MKLNDFKSPTLRMAIPLLGFAMAMSSIGCRKTASAAPAAPQRTPSVAVTEKPSAAQTVVATPAAVAETPYVDQLGIASEIKLQDGQDGVLNVSYAAYDLAARYKSAEPDNLIVTSNSLDEDDGPITYKLHGNTVERKADGKPAELKPDLVAPMKALRDAMKPRYDELSFGPPPHDGTTPAIGKAYVGVVKALGIPIDQSLVQPSTAPASTTIPTAAIQTARLPRLSA